MSQILRYKTGSIVPNVLMTDSGGVRTHEASHAKSPYRCTDCRGYFSVKTNTIMHKSQLPLRKWVFAIYLEMTSLKGVSSLKLHRDIGIS